MKTAIIGGGWVGQRLATFLTIQRHTVTVTTTTPEKIPVLQNFAAEVQVLDFKNLRDVSFLNTMDAVVFSMPISRGDWFSGFSLLDIPFPKTLLFSSTGIYPQEKRIFTEEDTFDLRPDILAAETVGRNKYPQTNILRFGGLMGDERTMQNIYRHRTPENLSKKVNHIHYQDILNAVKLVLESDKSGQTWNLVAPQHPTVGEILDLTHEVPPASPQRIISPERFISEFNYTFIHPNPKYF